jgi:hypothetical protein
MTSSATQRATPRRVRTMSPADAQRLRRLLRAVAVLPEDPA